MSELTGGSEKAVQASLPTELVLRILGFLIEGFNEDTLPFQTDKQNMLAAIARSSRRMQAIVEPLLYQNITLVSGKEIERLLYAVLLKPLRRDYVRSLDIRWRSDKENVNWSEVALFFESSLSTYLKSHEKRLLNPALYGTVSSSSFDSLARRTGWKGPFDPITREDLIAAKHHGISESFLYALAARSPAAQTTLLLHELNALERLTISADHRRDYWFWAGFLGPSPCLPVHPQPLSAGLGFLQTLVVDVKIDSSRAFMCFLLPQLKRLVITTDDSFDGKIDWDILPVIEGTSPVQELEVMSRDTDPISIRRILRAPAGLVKLRFAHDTIELPWDEEDWITIGSALQDISTLTHLEIASLEEGWEMPSWIGPLRRMDSLTHISIPVAMLVQDPWDDPSIASLSEMLPPTVKELDIRNVTGWMNDGMTTSLVTYNPQLDVLYCLDQQDVNAIMACQSNGVMLRDKEPQTYQDHYGAVFWRWTWDK